MSADWVTYLGTIPLDLYNFDVPTESGEKHQKISLEGIVPLAQGRQLVELASNRSAEITLGDETGVFVPFYPTAPWAAGVRGFALLLSARCSPERVDSDVEFATVSAELMLLGNRQIRLIRWARARSNIYGITPRSVVDSPTWVDDPVGVVGEAWTLSPGGVAFTRELDAGSYREESTGVRPATQRLQTASMTPSDGLPRVVLPAPSPPVDGVAPSWVTHRCGDLEVYDRKAERSVYGPHHHFERTSDLVVTNGLLRLLVGARGSVAYLNVQAYRTGKWRHVGALASSGATMSDLMVAARVIHQTPHEVTIQTESKDLGESQFTLCRHERIIRVVLGSNRTPLRSMRRQLSWLGAPPALSFSGVTIDNGHFGIGLRLGPGGAASWAWPQDSLARNWAVAGRWLPDSGSSVQPSSGIFTLRGDSGVAGSMSWLSTEKAMRLTVADKFVDVPTSFNEGDDVFWVASMDVTHGLSLSVSRLMGVVNRTWIPDASDPGTTEAAYRSIALGSVSGGSAFGEGAFGEGPFGGEGTTLIPNGVIDNLMIFDGALSRTEIRNLADAELSSDNLPRPGGRLLWHAAFDVFPIAYGSPLINGQRYEATESGGSTRGEDIWGFTKGLGSRNAVSAAEPFSIWAAGQLVEMGAWLATDAVNDDLLDQHAQYAGDQLHEMRA